MIGTEPTAAGWLRGMLPSLKLPNCVVSSFSTDRFVGLRELITDQFPLAEMVPLGDLAGRVMASMGMPSMRLPQTDIAEEAIACALLELPDDAWFSRSRFHAGSHGAIEKAMSTLRHWGLGPAELREYAATVESPLSQKLLELASLDLNVDGLLSELGMTFNRARLETMLEEPPPRLNGQFVILAGTEIRPLDKDWLFWLAEGGNPVTILVDQAPNDRFFPGASFWGEVEPPEAAPNDLAGRLFAINPVASERTLTTEVWTMPDRLAECEWTLRRVAELRDAGESLSSMAILAKQADRYRPLLEVASKLHEVELTMSQRVPLLNSRFGKLVCELLVAVGGPNPRRLLPFLSSGYLRTAVAEREPIREALFGSIHEENPWEALQSKSLPTWLAELLEWRADVINRIQTLAEWRDSLDELTKKDWMIDATEGAAYEVDSIAASAMIRAIARVATFERFAASRPLGYAGFLRRARQAWEKEELAVPGHDGGVRVVSSAAALGLVDTVFALGLAEGEFPRRGREDPVFTDDELARISAQMPAYRPPLPGSEATAQQEQDEFYRLVATPFERLILSYPESDEDQSMVASGFLSEVRVPVHSRSRRQWHAPVPRTSWDEIMAAAAQIPTQVPGEFVLSDPTVLLRVAEPQKEALTVSQLEDASECAFRHFAQWRLQLEPRSLGQAFRQVYGLPRRAQLAVAPDPETAKKRLDHELDDLIVNLTGRVAGDELREIQATGRRLVDDWVDREFGARRVWPRNETVPDLVGFDYPPFRPDLKGFGVRLTGDFPARSVRGGYEAIHLFAGGNPIDSGQDFERIKEANRLRYGLILFSLPPGKQAIEIDSANGGRTLIFYPHDSTPNWRSEGTDFVRVMLDPNRKREFWQSIEPRLRRAIQVIKQGVTTPEPAKDRCAMCVFGDLCRRSFTYGDTLDPFELVAIGEELP